MERLKVTEANMPGPLGCGHFGINWHLLGLSGKCQVEEKCLWRQINMGI